MTLEEFGWNCKKLQAQLEAEKEAHETAQRQAAAKSKVRR